jgi:hypothetical protein
MDDRMCASVRSRLVPVTSIPTRGERSRELARTPCCDAPWVTPKSGKARDRYAVCSDCRKTVIQWELTAPPASKS